MTRIEATGLAEWAEARAVQRGLPLYPGFPLIHVGQHRGEYFVWVEDPDLGGEGCETREEVDLALDSWFEADGSVIVPGSSG